MGELGKDWLRGVGVTVPVTGGWGEQPSLAVIAGNSPSCRALVLSPFPFTAHPHPLLPIVSTWQCGA